MRPLLTVCIFAYNHEKFIAQAIESVINQKTNFEFEIIVGEDGSTDKTMEILHRIQDSNSKKIQILIQDQSKKIYLNGRPTGKWNVINTLSHAKGKYISLLDGDDYWTDPLKLQKQVDFLEANPDYSASFHRVEVKDEFNGTTSISENFEMDTFNFKDMSERVMINTCSFLMRKDVVENSIFDHLKIHIRDYLVFLIAAKLGNIKFFSDIMGVYRLHPGGVWVGDSSNKKYLEHYKFICRVEKEFLGEGTVVFSNFKKQKEWALQNWIQPHLEREVPEKDLCKEIEVHDHQIIISLCYNAICTKNIRYKKLLNSKKMKFLEKITSPLRTIKKLLK